MIIVDELRDYPRASIKPAARRYGTRWCHLVSDTSLDELHAFARRIGLGLTAFSVMPMPHYDVTPPKREQAVKRGATEMEGMQLILHCLERRASYNPRA